MVMYYEALSINLALYNMTSALVNRRRPLTFNTDKQANGDPVVPLSAKQKPNVKESFFSGHTSNAAAATFFGAKIFTDFRPHSKLVPFVWVAAAAVPAFTAFSRYKAGKHFPSDVVTGYLIGASVGYLVPELHKIDKDNRVSLAPYMNGKGFAMSYTF
jgi:membrane-associated phospholipid phosphatase